MKRQSRLKLMLYGMLGVGIGIGGMLGLLRLLEVELPPAFWISIGFGIPGLACWLWSNRSPDNTRFKPKWW
jgi:hypothetical protein